jgi:hypothetical protein
MRLLRAPRIAVLLMSAAICSMVSGIARASTLSDSGFESQGTASGISGSYCYGTDCAAGSWNFSPLVPDVVGDGIISQGSAAWGAPIGNDNSNYFAFVQINGSFSQTFTANQSGTLTLSWIDAARSNFGGTETYTVSVNDQQVGIYSPTNSAFAPETSAAFSVIADNVYTVTFQGVDPTLTDSTAFIDNVSISSTPLPSTWTMLLIGLLGVGFIAYRGTKYRPDPLAAA